MKYVWHKKFKGIGFIDLNDSAHMYGFCEWSILLGWFEIRKYKK
jgi:hypothetical protein